MEDFLYVNNNSLSKQLCKLIIINYESEEKKRVGCTSHGVDVNHKFTTDFDIPNSGEKWEKVYKVLSDELDRNVKKYIFSLNNKIQESVKEEKFQFFVNRVLINRGFMMQRYIKELGDFKYHDDFSMTFGKGRDEYRLITFIWYLNDVEDGGETEVFGKYRIKPEAGKILLFPASWTFPHRGIVPKSDNKYIITGWLYATMNEFKN